MILNLLRPNHSRAIWFAPLVSLLTLGTSSVSAQPIRQNRSPVRPAPYTYRPTGRVATTDITEANHKFATKYETRYLSVYSELDPQSTMIIAEPLAGFMEFVDKQVCPLKGDYPMKVYCFQNKETMKSFLLQWLSWRDADIYGCFLPAKNTFVTYYHSGFGTWTHESMHKVMAGSLREYDAWASEGIPTIFEKTFGYPTPYGWTFVYGYQNPWRLEILNRHWDQLTLTSIVESAQMGDGKNESQERLVGTFLNDSGKLQRYLELCRSGQKNGYHTYLEATFGQTLTQMEPYFQRYLKQLRAHWSEITQVPGSQCFFEKARYDECMATHAASLIKFKP